MKPPFKLFCQITYFILKLILGFNVVIFLAYSGLLLIKFLNPNGLTHELEIGGVFAISFIVACLATIFLITKLDALIVKKIPFLERKNLDLIRYALNADDAFDFLQS